VIYPPAVIPCDHTDCSTDGASDQDGREPDEQRFPSAIDDKTKHIPAKIVGSQPMSGTGWKQQLIRLHIRWRILGKPSWRDRE
ncbi:hypothetical protein, partial [Lysinibacillus sp. GbtcB16]|uniref:hypothetical protein n=1 Tax=Lysinibacillus sp. GbtcB16 TaxID=2824761 RepID=UPI001C2F9D16